MKHEVLVVEVGSIGPHPNADALGITTVSGYTVVVRLADWREGDRGVYIEPDYVVPEAAPWAAMLGGKTRIKVKRLRGVVSQGLLLPLAAVGLPAGTPVGTDVMGELGIVRYQPPENIASGDAASPPLAVAGLPAYDLENWRKYGHLFRPGEQVVVTEKLHGESARYTYESWSGRLHIGSRTMWKKPEAVTPFSVALKCNPWIETWCRANPDLVLFGEVFGNVPQMNYGIRSKGMAARGFRAFDVWVPGNGARFLDVDEFENIVPAEHRVPVLYRGAAGNVTEALAEGVSTLGPHVREGCVIKPVVERREDPIGRLALKLVGNSYYESGA